VKMKDSMNLNGADNVENPFKMKLRRAASCNT
jgi:hypothetical protein